VVIIEKEFAFNCRYAECQTHSVKRIQARLGGETSIPPEVRPNCAGSVDVVTLNSLMAPRRRIFIEGRAELRVGNAGAVQENFGPKFCPPAILDSKMPEDDESLLVSGTGSTRREEDERFYGPKMALPRSVQRERGGP